jgi:hypothetical protein
MHAVFLDVAPCGSCLNQDLHGVTSQETAFFIVTAVKTSNIMSLSFLYGVDSEEYSASIIEERVKTVAVYSSETLAPTYQAT